MKHAHEIAIAMTCAVTLGRPIYSVASSCLTCDATCSLTTDDLLTALDSIYRAYALDYLEVRDALSSSTVTDAFGSGTS